MAPRLPNYLRAFRKRSTLSQEEVTFLMGAHGGAKVCRHEGFLRVPSLETALAYEVIFRKPIADLFPGIREKIQKQVQARARVLMARTFSHVPPHVKARKRQALESIVVVEERGRKS